MKRLRMILNAVLLVLKKYVPKKKQKTETHSTPVYDKISGIENSERDGDEKIIPKGTAINQRALIPLASPIVLKNNQEVIMCIVKTEGDMIRVYETKIMGISDGRFFCDLTVIGFHEMIDRQYVSCGKMTKGEIKYAPFPSGLTRLQVSDLRVDSVAAIAFSVWGTFPENIGFKIKEIEKK